VERRPPKGLLEFAAHSIFLLAAIVFPCSLVLLGSLWLAME
jgi:hypothetical protein